MIRRAIPADIPALHALVEAAFRGDSARAGWTHEADLLGGQRTDPDMLAAMLADPRCALLLAEEGGVFLGCVAVTRVAARRSALGMLAVRPDRQAGGLGRALVAAAEDHAWDEGAGAMEMTVIGQRGDLIAWYERRGYRRTGERRAFPLDDARFGLPYTRTLYFEVLERSLGE
ncbi:GNAT family N-acetyltransferase [Sphingomonas silueang]|uniref:GNAT family N-acetyltransferase n=1 Tax=Sphingomonas silueang TaxID=3156617 RepID=UPI0032B43B86